MRLAERLLFLAAALACGTPAGACTISAVGVSFGAYDPRSATPDDSAGSVSVNCPKAVKTASISMNTGSSGSYAARRMTSGASTLDYNLYTTATRTSIWGNGTVGTAIMTVLTGLTTLQVYGRIPAGQNVRAGSYSDSITVTVTF